MQKYENEPNQATSDTFFVIAVRQTYLKNDLHATGYAQNNSVTLLFHITPLTQPECSGTKPTARHGLEAYQIKIKEAQHYKPLCRILKKNVKQSHKIHIFAHPRTIHVSPSKTETPCRASEPYSPSFAHPFPSSTAAADHS